MITDEIQKENEYLKRELMKIYQKLQQLRLSLLDTSRNFHWS